MPPKDRNIQTKWNKNQTRYSLGQMKVISIHTFRIVHIWATFECDNFISQLVSRHFTLSACEKSSNGNNLTQRIRFCFRQHFGRRCCWWYENCWGAELDVCTDTCWSNSSSSSNKSKTSEIYSHVTQELFGKTSNRNKQVFFVSPSSTSVSFTYCLKYFFGKFVFI